MVAFESQTRIETHKCKTKNKRNGSNNVGIRKQREKERMKRGQNDGGQKKVGRREEADGEEGGEDDKEEKEEIKKVF